MTGIVAPHKGTKTDLPKRLAFGLTMLLHGEHMSAKCVCFSGVAFGHQEPTGLDERMSAQWMPRKSCRHIFVDLSCLNVTV